MPQNAAFAASYLFNVTMFTGPFKFPKVDRKLRLVEVNYYLMIMTEFNDNYLLKLIYFNNNDHNRSIYFCIVIKN